MIVIEGPDGAGKTTLKERLFDDIPALDQVERHCNTHGPVTNLKDWVDFQLKTPNQIRATHVYDRHALISEPIYGPLIRGHMVPGFENDKWYAEAWRLFLAQHPIIIFCLPPIGNVIENLEQSEQMRGVMEHITPIYYAYMTLYLRSVWHGNKGDSYTAIRWDYTLSIQDEEYNNLANFIRWYLYKRGIKVGDAWS